jgi:hypothetical protein
VINSLTLDQPEEIAALFGDGFALRLANSQEITIRVKGKLINMDGQFQFLMLNVKGSNETISTAMQKLSEFFRTQMNGSEAKPAIESHAPALPQDFAKIHDPDPPVKRRKRTLKPRRAKIAAPRRSIARGKFPCRHCNHEPFPTKAGRGRHESSAHPKEWALGNGRKHARGTGGGSRSLYCRPCDLPFVSEDQHRDHQEKVHGVKFVG